MTNKHELFSLGIKAGNLTCVCVCCKDVDGVMTRMTYISSDALIIVTYILFIADLSSDG